MLEPIALSNDVKTIEQSLVRGELTKAICYEDGYFAFTRGDIDKIMKEQNFQQLGMVDDDTRKRIGALQGVDYVCVMKITKSNQFYYIEASFVDIETGKISSPATIFGELQYSGIGDMKENCEKLAYDLLNGYVSPYSKIYKIRQMKQERQRQVEIERQRQAEIKRQAEEERLRQEELARQTAEQERIQANINRPWRELLKKVLTNVTYRYDSGQCYIGQRIGIQLRAFPDNDIYCGLANGKRNGKGMYIFSDGSAYVGNWKDDKRHDKEGRLYDKNGKLIYCGKYYKSKRKGEYLSNNVMLAYTFGIINYDNGDKYIGEKYQGQRHGMGLYIWLDGSAWYGNWTNGSRDGEGIYMPYSGGYSVGIWKGDTKIN